MTIFSRTRSVLYNTAAKFWGKTRPRLVVLEILYLKIFLSFPADIIVSRNLLVRILDMYREKLINSKQLEDYLVLYFHSTDGTPIDILKKRLASENNI